VARPHTLQVVLLVVVGRWRRLLRLLLRRLLLGVRRAGRGGVGAREMSGGVMCLIRLLQVRWRHACGTGLLRLLVRRLRPLEGRSH
jgi:hypothetical protein